jgi:outer membrane lipoprotein-sorting protein
MPYIPTMPKNRVFPALAGAVLIPLAAWAQPPTAPTAPAPIPGSVQAAQAAAAAANEPPTEAEKTLDAAAKKLAALTSVSADVAQSVDMLDQKFTIQGRYLKGPNRRIYLKLTVSGLPDATGVMLQVCDGQTLWDYQQILESQSYRKVEIGQVFERLKSPALDDKVREEVLSRLGFAGPEELLIGLRRSVKFDQQTTETLDGKEVWVLRGEWKDRSGLLGPNQQPLPLTTPLPAYIPSLVIVSIGKDDSWPYKIRLVGRRPTMLIDTRRVGPDGQKIGARNSIQEVKPTAMELTYTNVKINPELKLDEFVFQAPPSARVDDSTQQLVGMLDQAIQVSEARKKAEAAKGEGPLLNEPIAVPRQGDTKTPAPLTPPATPR